MSASHSSALRILHHTITALLLLLLGAPALHAQLHVQFTVDVDSGAAPLTVRFTDGSTPGDSVIFRAWDFNDDGIMDSDERQPWWTYEVPGRYSVTLIVADSAGYDTLRIANMIDVAPIPQSEIAVGIRVVEPGGPYVSTVELWGYAGSGDPTPFSPISIRMPVDTLGYANFYWMKFLPMMTQNITELLLLDATGTVVGKTGFHYPLKDLSARRRKDAIVVHHRDMSSYADHPVEQPASTGWLFPTASRFPWHPGRALAPFIAMGEAVTGRLNPTTLLIPPARFSGNPDGRGQYRFAHIRPDRRPLILLGDLARRDAAWGADIDVLGAIDIATPGFNGKSDYAWTSYPGRVQRLDAAAADAYDVWQIVHPPDQSFEENGWLLARDLDVLAGLYDTNLVAAVGHGTGGLALRAYMQGSARAYMYFGDESTVAFRGDITDAVFIATPHAGRFRAGLAYGTSPLVSGFMDAAAPALRELSPAAPSLLRLAGTPLPAGVRMLSLAGSPPVHHVEAQPRESRMHDDGVVALASALLDRHGVWNGALAGFSNDMLHAPDLHDPGATIPDAQFLPEVMHAFLRSDSALWAQRLRMLFLMRPDSLRFGEGQLLPAGAAPLRVDVSIPVLRLFEAPALPFDPALPWRIRLTQDNLLRFELETIEDEQRFADAGLFFYPADVRWLAPPQQQRIEDWNALYPMTRPGSMHPLSSQTVQHDGYGWPMPAVNGGILFDPVLALRDDRGRRHDVATLGGTLDCRWSRSTLNDFVMSPQVARIARDVRRLRGVLGGLPTITADCLTRSITFVVSYPGRPAPVIEVTAPDQSVLTAANANDSTIFHTRIDALGSLLYTILDPMPGEWTLRLDNEVVVPEQCTLAVHVENGRNVRLHTSAEHVFTGDTVLVSLSIDNDGPLPGSPTAQLLLTDSANTTSVFPMRDDGVAPDTLANDGVFTTRFIPTVEGMNRLRAEYSALSTNCAISRVAIDTVHVRMGLQLLAPNGGEEWRSGGVRRIAWRGSAPTTVRVEYSVNNGANWTVFAPSVTMVDGGIDWIIPDLTSERCLVRVVDVDGWRSDTSDAVFTIFRRPELQLLRPAGGELWQVGDTENITWDALATHRIDISYSTDRGAGWLPIASGVDARTGVYAWTIPVTPADSCLLRITDMDEASVFATSPPFRIRPIPALRVIAPNGGERWTEGSTQLLRWQSAAVDSVELRYSADAGVTWLPIAHAHATDGLRGWVIPQTPSAHCLFRITGIDRPDLDDVSDDVFEIVPIPRLRVLAPSGGEQWEIGSVRQIRWESAGIERVDIAYTTDNGGFWRSIAINLPAAMGAYNWTVPVEPSNACRIRISDTYDSAHVAVSPQVFSISESSTRPTLFAPTDASTGVSTRPGFWWLPFSGAAMYQLQVTTDPQLGFWTIDRNDLRSTNFSSPELLPMTTYHWRVRARVGSVWTDWSAVWTFTTSASTIGTPRLQSPLDGAIGLAPSTQFVWAATDTAASWHLQVAEDLGFVTLVEDRLGIVGFVHSSGVLEVNSDYYWRVRGGNQGSTAFGDWSEVRRFSTAPPPPRHLSPLDGFPDVALTPLLQWYPVPDARTYRMQIGLDESFSTIVFDSTLAVSSVRAPRLWSFWTYHWRVQVTTGRGTSVWSAPWYFRTMDIGTAVEATTPPGLPHVLWIAPQPAATEIRVALAGITRETRVELVDLLGRVRRVESLRGAMDNVELRWMVSDLPPGRYHLRIHSMGRSIQHGVTIVR